MLWSAQGVGKQVCDGLGGGVGDGGVDGDLVFVAVVGGFDVEGGEQPFGECGGGAGEDVPEGGEFVQQGGVVFVDGGCFQGGEL